MLIENSPMFDLADQLAALRDDKAKLEDRLKKLNKYIEETAFRLSDQMALSEIQNFTRAGITFSLRKTTHVSSVSERKDDLYKAIKKEGFGDLVYETVNANLFSSFVREQIGANEGKLPKWLDGLVNLYGKFSIGVRKASK